MNTIESVLDYWATEELTLHEPSGHVGKPAITLRAEGFRISVCPLVDFRGGATNPIDGRSYVTWEIQWTAEVLAEVLPLLSAAAEDNQDPFGPAYELLARVAGL